tara:strand:+ start:50 stop:247 length:198 start_codon:yes stop_codon:yes gene_type:complete
MPTQKELDKCSMVEFSRRLENAAVGFARDFGPLTAASAGDKKARAKVADQLSNFLAKNDLTVCPT